MADIFKVVIPAILQTKKNVLDSESDIKEYDPYIVNKALSFHQDCIPYVNEINMYPFVDKDMQFQFYLNTIRAMKRKFQPWVKKSSIKDIDAIKEYFGYSNTKANEAFKILTKEHISYIKEKIDKGGVK